MSSDPEKPCACGATLRVERAKRADRLHERLGREIRDVLRLTTAPREKRRHASHVRAVQSLKLRDSPPRRTLTRPQKRARRAGNTHKQYLAKPLAHVTNPCPRSGVIPEHWPNRAFVTHRPLGSYLSGVNTHRLSRKLAGRPALTALVLSVTAIACLWLAQYKEWNVIPTGPRGGEGIDFSPVWATPGAIAIGVVGLIVALLLLRPNRSRR